MSDVIVQLALQRAWAAEAEVARLKIEIATTDEDNRILRDKLQSAAEKIATMSAHLSRLAEKRQRELPIEEVQRQLDDAGIDVGPAVQKVKDALARAKERTT